MNERLKIVEPGQGVLVSRYDLRKWQWHNFHEQSPETWYWWQHFAIVMHGHVGKVGPHAVHERVRWEAYTGGIKDEDGYKINNTFAAFYGHAFTTKYPEYKRLPNLKGEIKPAIEHRKSTMIWKVSEVSLEVAVKVKRHRVAYWGYGWMSRDL